MPERCSNCGAELFEGQQFCRRCGAPVGRAGAEAPTQLFPQGPQPARGAAGTSPARGETGAVGVGQPTAYHQPASFQQTSPLVGHAFGSRPLAVEPPARKRRRGLWLFALLAVFVLGAGLVSGAGYLWWREQRRQLVVGKIGGGSVVVPVEPGAPRAPAAPPVPADLGGRIKEALKGAGVPLPLDESGATVTGTDTVLTQTYELGPDSSVAVHAARGSVTVTGTDGDEAVVKITKRGGSPQEREAARVLASKTGEGLTLITAPAQAAAVSVSYEISLPRNLRRLEISAERGDLKVSEFDGPLVLNLTNGDISVAAGGTVRSRLVNGKTVVSRAGGRDGAQEFSVVNGDIEVSLGDEPEVDLRAAATNGEVEADDALGVKAEKRGPGQRLDARLGGGGPPLTVKVVNGDIRLKK